MAEQAEHLCEATLPDQRKLRFSTFDFTTGLTRELERIVRESGIKTGRKNPQKVNVHVAQLKAPKKPGDDWQVVSRGLYPVMPPLERMTQAEFDADARELLLRIPVPLHAALHHLAWEHGHSAGLEEVFNYLSEYVDALEQPLAKYREQLLDRDSPGA